MTCVICKCGCIRESEGKKKYISVLKIITDIPQKIIIFFEKCLPHVIRKRVRYSWFEERNRKFEEKPLLANETGVNCI